MESVKKSLVWAYYLCFLMVIIVAVGSYLMSRSGMVFDNEQAKVTIKSILIIYVLASIPFSLWFHHREVVKMGDDVCTLKPSEKLKRYRMLSFLRIGLITFGLMASILFCYVMVQRDLLYLALICAVSMIFCKPTTKKLDEDFSVFYPSESQKSDNQ